MTIENQAEKEVSQKGPGRVKPSNIAYRDFSISEVLVKCPECRATFIVTYPEEWGIEHLRSQVKTDLGSCRLHRPWATYYLEGKEKPVGIKKDQ